jgi:GntR family transcriptional regulator
VRQARPRYRIIADELRARLGQGEWGPADLLPSEAALSDAYQASRVTVRRALESLRQDGLLDSRQGFGWFVASPPLRQSLVRLGTIEEQLAASGRSSERRVLGFAYMDPPAAVAELLGPDQVLEVRRLNLADGQPFALVTVWCPAALATELSRADVQRQTFIELLPIEVGGARQAIGAALAGSGDAEVLDIPEGSPVLRAWRVTHDHSGTPVLVAEHLFPAHRTEFVVDLPHADTSMAATGLQLVG